MLGAIANDRTSGAALIEKKIYARLISLYGGQQRRSSPSIKKDIIRLKRRFGNMANVLGLLRYMENISENPGNETILKLLKDYRQRLDINRESTIRTAAKTIKRYGSIFTLSNSSVITQAVLLAKTEGWKGTVNITESRPKREGLISAKRFAKAGLKVNYGIDFSAPHLIRRSGAIFFGADAVTQTYFVNKTGTEIALVYGEKHGKPLFVAADRSKFVSNREFIFSPDENPVDEVLRFKHQNLNIMNRYFEKAVPRGRMKYICGDKVFEPIEVRKLLKHPL